MNRLLVICDCEKTYGKRLYEYMLKKHIPEFQIKFYTSVELLINNLGGCHIGVLMIDEISYVEFINLKSANKLKVDKIKILTTKSPNTDFIAEECVYKYQSAKDMLNIITGEFGITMPDLRGDIKKKEMP